MSFNAFYAFLALIKSVTYGNMEGFKASPPSGIVHQDLAVASVYNRSSSHTSYFWSCWKPNMS